MLFSLNFVIDVPENECGEFVENFCSDCLIDYYAFDSGYFYQDENTNTRIPLANFVKNVTCQKIND